ncbi:MAG: cation-translocating P-type ATPase [Bacteroidetes bacterium]|nr:cation-translocating P-type ATPase [Bacteroidota bacterium]
MEHQGLENTFAQERLAKEGFNELPSAKPKNLWQIALEVIQEPMFLLLIACGTLYLLLGDYREGIVLTASVLVIIAITFYQHRKTERALESLRNLSSPRAMVIRGGVEKRIAGREVVREDLLIVQEGDRIPADARLISGETLMIDESLLTGESIPVTRFPGNLNQQPSRTEQAINENIFSGTLVVSGKGIAKVTATGIHTRLGKIGKSLEDTTSVPTRLQQEMKITIRRFGMAGVGISILVTAIYFLTHGALISALLTGLSSAMAILPEEFPVVMTVFLALGAWRLSKIQVLTRKPSAIETLGAATVLCADKTGTITMNRMEVAEMVDESGEGWIKNKQPVRSSLYETIKFAALACSNHPTDPTEKAIVACAGLQSIDITTVAEKTYPLKGDWLMMANAFNSQTGYTIAAKGAPEFVLNQCQLSPEQKALILKEVNRMASNGLRVLAVAGIGKTTSLPEHGTDLQLQYKGLIGLEDPIRPEVPEAIADCTTAGIRVIMITGDYPMTAGSIGKKIGLNHDSLMSGEELGRLSDEQLSEKIEAVKIFARIMPEQKLRIVRALQKKGEVVAMTGDGVNDAPALKAADIGIAMGAKGTDVAREASSLVLLDDNFASIVRGMRLGRRIYDNIQKAMMFILAIHVPIIGFALIPAFMPELPLLLFPLHIVFMELLIDPICSIAFENEPEEPGIMRRPPRNPKERFFGWRQAQPALINGSVILSMTTLVYFLSLREGHHEDEVRFIAFTGLILANIGFILSSLSRSRFVLEVLGEKNLPVKIILGSAAGLLLLIAIFPITRELFHFKVPNAIHLWPSLAGSLGVITIFELRKYFELRHHR